MFPSQKSTKRGFTLIELLVVIAIIGILSAVVLMSISDSRMRGRDTKRKSQSTEILKAIELYFSDNGVYPLHNGSSNSGGYLVDIEPSLYSGANGHLGRLPDESATDYYYCVSADRKSVMLAVNTENDKGGSDWCNITRSSPPYGCDAWITANASSRCAPRF